MWFAAGVILEGRANLICLKGFLDLLDFCIHIFNLDALVQYSICVWNIFIGSFYVFHTFLFFLFWNGLFA